MCCKFWLGPERSFSRQDRPTQPCTLVSTWGMVLRGNGVPPRLRRAGLLRLLRDRPLIDSCNISKVQLGGGCSWDRDANLRLDARKLSFASIDRCEYIQRIDFMGLNYVLFLITPCSQRFILYLHQHQYLRR